MKNNLELLKQIAKKPKTPRKNNNDKIAVAYTRVSSKEQYETNLSLEWQKKAVDEYAIRGGYKLDEYFGGIFESAKGDGRKEFQRMLTHVRKNKRITHILVYMLDRFSRTGGGAIQIANELREKYGVTIVAVSQPIDTTNPGGIFQQNIQFLFSEYDNEVRKQRTITGMNEQFKRGIWCINPPIGYSIIYANSNQHDIKKKGDRKIVINETGQIIKKAFEWKVKGMKNEEIMQKLKLLGLNIYKQKLSKIFSNPFYCGIITTKSLNGEIYEGVHEKLVSHDLFLKVNNIRKSNGQLGVPHKAESNMIPLKIFIKCHACGSSYTGYRVNAKKLWYYKCRKPGCYHNISAKKVNNIFENLLNTFTIKDEWLTLLKERLKLKFNEMYSEHVNDEKIITSKMSLIDKKIEQLEEDYYINKSIPNEIFNKLSQKLKDEKLSFHLRQDKMLKYGLNLEKTIKKSIEISSKLATVWHLSQISEKEKLQYLLFPNGITFNSKNLQVLTHKVNEIFNEIAYQQMVLEDFSNDKADINVGLSPFVPQAGLEPALALLQTGF